MTAAADRLSDLPDDLLRRILYFTAAKEGASTTVLSRRWPSLWRTSGAVNLHTRSYDRTHGPMLGDDPIKRDAFPHGAMAALAVAAEHGPLSRLSFHMENGHDDDRDIRTFVSYRPDESEMELEAGGWEEEHNLISEVVSSPFVWNAEELHVAGVVPGDRPGYSRGGYYKLNMDDQTFEGLRVLHIVNAEVEVGWSDASFPLLNSLLLRGCNAWFVDLQAMIHGAPRLATVRLESIKILNGCGWQDTVRRNNRSFLIRGPEVTELVLTDWSGFGLNEIGSIELDMPQLRYFT